MKTAIVLIGNSDDKLSQKEWFEFTMFVSKTIDEFAGQRYFVGYSLQNVPWQNAAYCFDISDEKEEKLHNSLKQLATTFRQDSIAYLCGKTQFLTP